jgi:hypothetical protein
MSAARFKPLTATMLAELRCIDRFGTFRELDDYSRGPLAFYAREKVLTALMDRGFIADAETITDAGRAAIAKHKGAA